MRALFIAILCSVSLSAFSQAKINIEKKVYDFGTFKEGADSVCQFTVKNTGNAPLIIISISKPCGCTTPSFTKKPIGPNETGTITVRYSSDGHPGYFRKNLQVRSNDPKNDVVVITITGKVTPKDKD